MEDFNEDNSLTSDVFVDVVVVVAQFPYYLLLTSACYGAKILPALGRRRRFNKRKLEQRRRRQRRERKTTTQDGHHVSFYISLP